jgi:FeS assembly protein IscX
MMDWRDTRDIAISLEEAHPDADNLNLRFTDLRTWVLALEGFTGAPDGCNEKILEAIQLAWLDERE